MNKGKIMMLCGLPGAGKSTYAKKLEKETGSIRLEPDEWVEPLMQDPHSWEENDRIREIVEKLLFDMAIKLAKAGNIVTVENGFWAAEERKEYREKAQKQGVDIDLVYLEVSMEELWKRVEKRNDEYSEGIFRLKKEDMEKWFKQFQPPSEEEGKEFSGFEVIC